MAPSERRRKLDSWTLSARFIGYAKDGHYHFWVVSGVGPSGSVVVSRDAAFRKKITGRENDSITFGLDVPDAVGGVVGPEAATQDVQTWLDPREKKRTVHISSRLRKKSALQLHYEESRTADKIAFTLSLSEVRWWLRVLLQARRPARRERR